MPSDFAGVTYRAAPAHQRAQRWARQPRKLVGHATASALGTLLERTTRFTGLVPLMAKDAATVRQDFVRKLRTIPELRRSLTYDQGPEMREHRLFRNHTKM